MTRPPSSRARAALVTYVRGAGDRRLERTLASRPALRLLLLLMARRFDPAAAAGFTGTVRVELSTTRGRGRAWTILVGAHSARVRAGLLEEEPALVVRATAADLIRMAAGVLHPARALLSGRLDLAGDFGVARRVGPMFGAGSAL